MLKGVEISADGDVRVDVLLTIAGCPLRDRINNDVTAAVAPLEGVRRVEVRLGEMTGDQRQSLVSQLRGDQAPQQTFFTSGDTEVIAVASGKGGVGKSSVTASLAAAMAAEGQRVGVLDADVWGFSIPRMLGASGQPVGFNNMILPLEAHGVKVISMGFFVSDETPVIWRGPMLHKALQQFLGDVYWGDLDVLLVDMPPGTGDVSLSLASFLPSGSMIVVTTPQEAASKVAERAGRMAQHPNVQLKLLGVIENMSGFVCPHCGEITDLFGTGGGRATADALGVPLLGAGAMQASRQLRRAQGSGGGVKSVVRPSVGPTGTGSSASAGSGRMRNRISSTIEIATAAIEVHWLPVSPKNVLSILRRSVMTRPSPYQMANDRISTPSRRGRRFSQNRNRNRPPAMKKSYSAVWWTPAPVATTSPLPSTSVAPPRDSVSVNPPLSRATHSPGAVSNQGPGRVPPRYAQPRKKSVGFPRWSPMIRSPMRPMKMPKARPIAAGSITWKNR